MNKTISTQDQERWTAVIERDRDAGGQFVYAVSTTGIYCRPGCSSRQPKRENVHFFDAWPAAEQAGFRACKRCEPRADESPDPQRDAVLQACRLMDEADGPLTLDELAAAVGFSPFHFHRLFKKTTGITPKAYARERLNGRLRANLQEQPMTVTNALYDAGYGSSSRLYEDSAATLGMTPATYMKGAPGQTIRYATAPSYLGQVLVAATDQGVCRIDLGDSAAALEARLLEAFPLADFQPGDATFSETVVAVLEMLGSPQTTTDLPLDIQGTAFQQRVWSALRQIPMGTTASYGEVAEQIGRPGAARAVASACAANKLAVAIPCHRVIRANGELGGYRWGVERKQVILEQETAAVGR